MRLALVLLILTVPLGADQAPPAQGTAASRGRQESRAAAPQLTAANQHLSMKASVSAAAVAPGSRVTLAFDITPGRRIHVYAPGADYQVVDIAVEPNPLFSLGDTSYPPSEIYHFEPLDERVPVYQKPFRLAREVTIAATPEARAALRGKETVTLAGKLQYQACDDKVCYRPNAIPFKFELKVQAQQRR